MQESGLRTRWVRAACSFALLTLAVAGISACSGNDSTDSGAAGSTDPSAAVTTSDAVMSARALLPDGLSEGGTITIATNAESPPWEYIDTGSSTIVGIDADLVAEITARLGLKYKWANISFDGIIPGLQAGRFDLGSSSMTDTKEREAAVDFVDYYQKSNVLLVKDGNPGGITTMDDMCGKVAATQHGTDFATQFEDQSSKCEAAGKGAVEIREFPSSAAALLAIQTGRADATLEDYVGAVYQMEQTPGKYELPSAEHYSPSVYGFAFPQDSELAPAWQAALQSMVADGTYAKILHQWKIAQGLVDSVGTNGALS
jgi:polar amino acid transport system substrate-binding protein